MRIFSVFCASFLIHTVGDKKHERTAFENKESNQPLSACRGGGIHILPDYG